MIIKTTIEMEMEVPNETVIKDLYEEGVANNFKVFKQDITNTLLDDEWREIKILKFSIQDIDPSKFIIRE